MSCPRRRLVKKDFESRKLMGRRRGWLFGVEDGEAGGFGDVVLGKIQPVWPKSAAQIAKSWMLTCPSPFRSAAGL